jgi:hypothetical protein
MRAVLLLGTAAALLMAAPAQAQQATTMTIEAPPDVRHGEAHELTVTLTDARGRPLAGQTVTVLEEVRLFDYADIVVVGEVRTDYQGAATLTHVPTAPGRGSLIAQFEGGDGYGPSTASVQFTVAVGAGITTPLIPAETEPILPRGVTAVWFLPLLVGVWLALATSVYHLMRIPREASTQRAPV